MKQKVILILLLVLCCVGSGLKADFEYDEAQLNYQYLGQIHSVVNERWHCEFHWRGGSNQEIIVESDNMPFGMYIDHIDVNTVQFGWQPTSEDVGTYYIDFSLGKRIDPNTVFVTNWGTVVVKIEEAIIDPPVFEGIGNCRKR